MVLQDCSKCFFRFFTKKKKLLSFFWIMWMTGIEPARLAALEPKSSASASSATPAYLMVPAKGLEPSTY